MRRERREKDGDWGWKEWIKGEARKKGEMEGEKDEKKGGKEKEKRRRKNGDR